MCCISEQVRNTILIAEYVSIPSFYTSLSFDTFQKKKKKKKKKKRKKNSFCVYIFFLSYKSFKILFYISYMLIMRSCLSLDLTKVEFFIKWFNSYWNQQGLKKKYLRGKIYQI